MKKLLISDVTLRQDFKRQDAALSFREKVEIAKLLGKLSPYAIELPALGAEKVDALLVKSIAMAVKNCRLVLPVALKENGVAEAWNALREAAHPCLQITVPTSTVQMEYQCHKKPDQMVAMIGDLIREAKACCEEVEFVAEDATRAEEAFLVRAVQAAVDAGASRVTLSDTAGRLLPEETAAFVSAMLEKVSGLSEIPVGISCSDELHLAAACSVAAVQSGAQLVKATTAESGLLMLDALGAILRARGSELGIEADIAMTELQRITKQVNWITHSKRSASSPFDSGVQGAPAYSFRLDTGSAQAEVMQAVARLGYDLSEEDHAKVYESFRQIAAKKEVGEKELEAIIASAAMQVPPTYTLESYVINCGNIITATAHMKLFKQGKLQQGIAIGDGPIDAAFLAIEQIIGRHYELDDFQIQSVTEGREAMGSALVRLRADGKLYSGKGISTDIVGASIRAYINALNKIVYEESAKA